MQKLLLGCMMVATAVAVPAFAVEHEGLMLRAEKEYSLGAPAKGEQPQTSTPPSLRYSNLATFTGQTFLNGGAALQGTNTITRLTADDLTPTGGGQDVIEFKFSVVNNNAMPVTFRPRVRFWFADGASGAPGTYYNLPAAVGFSFNPVTVNASSVTIFTAALTAGQMTMPTSMFWAGMTFDNNSGTTGATATELNNLGQGIFDPPTVGSSADRIFTTTAAGSFFNTNDPAGAISNFSGNPLADFGWEFSVDSPIAVQPTVWSQVKGLYR